MSPERFEHLLQLVGPCMKIRHCRSRQPISHAERLALTLRFLATGDSQQSTSFNFRVSRTAVCNIIKETCINIWDALSGFYLKPPTSQEDWEKIATEFLEEWNFPNCLGALDGKHIAIECPGYSGSEYYNYKGFFSIVLMAMCDAKYCFTFINVGNYGKENDAHIFNNSDLGKAFNAGEMQIPSSEIVDGHELPYVIISDEIFALKSWLMKPYPGKGLTRSQAIFNYRLSRARRTIENCFGILAARWRIFRRPIRASPAVVDSITKACTCLHNYLRLTDNPQYLPSGFTDSEDASGNIVSGDWRIEVNGESGALRPTDMGRAFNRSSFSAKSTREQFEKYFNSNEGSLPWQNSHVESYGKTRHETINYEQNNVCD